MLKVRQVLMSAELAGRAGRAGLAAFALIVSVVSSHAEEIRAEFSEELVDLEQITEATYVITTGQFVSSGQPSEAALNVFAQSGYSAVIDLRSTSERRGFDEKEVVESLGMSYVNLPMSGSDDVSFANASKLDSLLAQYAGPVLVHCGSGNRVGALITLRAAMNNVDPDTALELGRKAGLTTLDDVVMKRLEDR